MLVLKGHETLVTDGDRIYRNPTGNPGMAKGGSGDLLTGIIAALIGQGLTPFDAAQLEYGFTELPEIWPSQRSGKYPSFPRICWITCPRHFSNEQPSINNLQRTTNIRFNGSLQRLVCPEYQVTL